MLLSLTYVVERSTVETLAYVEPSRETLMAFLLHYVKLVSLLRCELQYRHHNSWISWICWKFLICHRWPSAKLKIAFHPIKETHNSNVLFDWKIRKKLKWKKQSSFLVKPKIQCIFHYIAENVIGTVRKCVQHCRCSGVECNHQARFSSLLVKFNSKTKRIKKEPIHTSPSNNLNIFGTHNRKIFEFN